MARSLDTLPAGGPAIPARPRVLAAGRLGRRLVADRWAARLVAVGGGAVIASILAILVVIAAEVVPLFGSPSAERLAVPAPAASGAPAGALGADEYREIAHTVTESGHLGFMALRGPGAPAAVPVPGLDGAVVTAVAGGGAGAAAYSLGTSDGRVIPLEMRFEVAFRDGARAVTPAPVFGEPIRVDPEARRPVRRLTAARPETGHLVVAQVGPRDLVLWRGVERKALIGAGRREETREPLGVTAEGEVTGLLVDRRGEHLFLGTSAGQVVRLDLRAPAAPAEAVQVAPPGVAVSALGFLLGDRTLIVGSAAGGVSSWQVVPPRSGGAPRLTRVHEFQGHRGPVVSVTASPRDKGFATADRSGVVRVHYGTSGATLLALDAGPELRAVAFAPKADGLLTVDARGALGHWRLENPHPEVTGRTLFGRVWYEGYAGPEHVWQSTGGTDDFEAKFSLTPLIFGTLKGTLYALGFAAPLALLAALYVSEFMHPALRGYLKPVVELMAALPSVVLGFVAGLWLAPLVERVVPGLLVLPPVLAGSILAAMAAWRRLPHALRSRARAGSELLLLVPVTVLALGLALHLGAWLEQAALGGNYRAWLLGALGLTYDQRNSLVVGLAMGFAVIPVIFTIAEDALAGVPQHLRAGSLALGATRWQTALRVVLPTASPGIFSAVMIGFGRAVGETMIVLMATGNTPVMDWSPFNGFRALSANIAVELPEAPEGGTLFRVLFLAALLLFVMTFVVNTLAELVRLRLRRRYRYL